MREEEKVRILAEWYGYEPQSRQCIEEMAELTQAINKLWRKQNYGGNSKEIARHMQMFWKRFQMCLL